EQLLAVGVAETRAVPDEGELAVVVVEAEEERADLAAVLVLPEAAPATAAGPPLLDFVHRPLPRPYRPARALGDDPVEAGGFELVEPTLRRLHVGGGRGQVPRVLEVLAQLRQPPPAFPERQPAQVLASQRQDVEGDEPGRGLGRQLADARLGRVDPL